MEEWDRSADPPRLEPRSQEPPLAAPGCTVYSGDTVAKYDAEKRLLHVVVPVGLQQDLDVIRMAEEHSRPQAQAQAHDVAVVANRFAQEPEGVVPERPDVPEERVRPRAWCEARLGDHGLVAPGQEPHPERQAAAGRQRHHRERVHHLARPELQAVALRDRREDEP